MSDAVALAEATSFDRYTEGERLNRIAAVLPPAELAAVPPSLREAASALEPAHREQLLAELGSAPIDGLAALPPAESLRAMEDTFAHRLLGIARSSVERRAAVHDGRENMTTAGYVGAMADVQRQTREQADHVHAVLDQELDRLEQAASTELARHGAEAFAHPELELAVRARFADAFAAGATAMQDLFDAHLAGGNPTAARVLAQVATSTLAAVPQDDPRWGAARNMRPLAEAYSQALKPASVRRAEEQRVAVAASRQRLVQLRGLIIGV